MTEQNSLRKTAESHSQIAREVIPFLSKNKIPMTPDNYRIWYDYFRNDKDEIREELDSLLKANSTFEPAIMEKIYHKYYMRDLSAETNEKLADQMLATEVASKRATNLLGNALKEIIKSTESTSGYGKKLHNYLEDVEKAEKIEDIGNVLSLLVKDTTEATQNNDAIKEKLLDSSEQLTNLHSELVEAKKEAYTDNLTQLGNRRHFDEVLAKHLEKSCSGEFCSLLIIDIDHFKSFNDDYGHLIGDKLLSTLGIELKETPPKEAISCRYGGEEFAIILPGADVAAGKIEAEKVRKAIEDMEITVRGKAISVTVSVGVTQLISGDTAEAAIGRADKALYQAKDSGRNKVEIQ